MQNFFFSLLGVTISSNLKVYPIKLLQCCFLYNKNYLRAKKLSFKVFENIFPCLPHAHVINSKKVTWFILQIFLKFLKIWCFAALNPYQNTENISFSDHKCLTHSLPMHHFSIPENRKPYCFLMFSGGRQRVHWNKWVKKMLNKLSVWHLC